MVYFTDSQQGFSVTQNFNPDRQLIRQYNLTRPRPSKCSVNHVCRDKMSNEEPIFVRCNCGYYHEATNNEVFWSKTFIKKQISHLVEKC
jgi:hypothetical protein